MQPTAIVAVRQAGSNTNGGSFDPGISGAGTDYSWQDSPQLSISDIACSNTTTITSATGGFTSAMIGNAAWISGGGASAGPYWITAVASSNSATLDSSPGTISGGSAKIGGAWADPWTNLALISPGCTMRLRGSGSNKPTVDDYSRSGFVQVAGDLTNGMIRIIGENGKPRIASNGLMFFRASYLYFENVYVSTNGTNYATPYGVLSNLSPLGTGCNYLVECVLDQNGYDICMVTSNWTTIRCEVFSRTGSGGSQYAMDGQEFGLQIRQTNIHDTIGPGVRFSNKLGNHIADSIIAFCKGDGFTAGSAAQGTDSGANSCINNTFDANLGDAIKYDGIYGLQEMTAVNNIISNHTGSGKRGINVPFGSLAANDATRGDVDNNAFFGNTTDLNGISHGANDIVGTDPQYQAQSTQGYNIGTNLKGAGFPTVAFKNSSAIFTPTRSYMDMGGVQRQEGAA